MFKQIRSSKFTKFLAYYLVLMILLETTQPMVAYALTEGPSQPEFNSFTPIGTSDMVDLTSGDFNYNIPIMDVGGYPINLAYNSGVTMDQEASWVGLGWNLNIGQINRNVRGIPDDFSGDQIKTENNMKPNYTIGVNPYINTQIIGAFDNPNLGLSVGAGLDVSYNNYEGLNAVPSFGPSFKLSEYVSVGMQLSGSVDNGASISPSLSLSAKKTSTGSTFNEFSASISPSITYNSRQGLQSFNLSTSLSASFKDGRLNEIGKKFGSGSGSISFVNNTFLPTKRTSYKNNSIRFSFSAGPNIWGAHVEVSIAGYASVQKLSSNIDYQKAYGYQNTEYGGDSDLLDFNREKEQSAISKSTLVLPVTNYTYDMYSVQSQGVGGTFRPFRSQVGYLYTGKVVDQSASSSFGVELEVGGGVHKGLNYRRTKTNTYTSKWNTKAVPFLTEKIGGNPIDYERVYFKTIGEQRADYESTNLLGNSLGGSSPITLKLDVNKDAINSYRKKILTGTESNLDNGTNFNSQIKRNTRETRNQSIQKFTKGEVYRFGLKNFIELSIKRVNEKPMMSSHHTAGYIITDENGSRHIFGAAANNFIKKEVTFNVGNNTVNDENGLVNIGFGDNTVGNFKGRDNYFNCITTPSYTHTYLLTSILSPDYSDITGNGPTDDDLGSYTKFKYSNSISNDGINNYESSLYQWRVPYTKASYNEGLKTKKDDQKGSYIYGKKEIRYLKKIITKTHVAIFELVPRQDAMGVSNETNGGYNSTSSRSMMRIKAIRLYSKPELQKNNIDIENTNQVSFSNVSPIKTAHFEYNYSLCKNLENNSNESEMENGSNINFNRGKLTLKKVFFTYRNSNMGKYTAYQFNYNENNPQENPSYNPKAYDIWGNYKPFQSGSWLISNPNTTPQEFPYVDQNDSMNDTYASAWTLKSIELPSGGKIEINFESDDYKYVQNKRAMQMFKVDGVTSSPEDYDGLSNSQKTTLYNQSGDVKYIAVKLPQNLENNTDIPIEKIKRDYTQDLVGKPIYFNFLLNMTENDYEYVSGYFEMDGEAVVNENRKYIFIPMKKVDVEGNGSSGSSNPITLAGCFFGRQNLNREINGLDNPTDDIGANVVNVAKSIVKNIEVLAEIFTGPNKRLRNDFNCAKKFKPYKSWIRLVEPTGSKIGGGCRVKSIVMKDEWDKMMGISSNDPNLDRYAKQYGQEYNYDLEDGTSSGVATYEPNISKENPLVVPFYHKPEKLTAQSYQEKPFGESFFPSPTVTYSKVTVKNINSSGTETTTGKVVTHHYTTYDFPTKTDFTNLDKSKIFDTNESFLGSMIKSMVGMKIDIKTNLTLTQGFLIETNDMNGKVKKQEVFNQANSLISSVEYKYSTSDDGMTLNNKLTTIDETGKIRNDIEIGTHYDVFNDFNESYNFTNSYGGAVNVDLLPTAIPIILAWGMPERMKHTTKLNTAVTTKVIHKTGILIEKIAFDLGSKVSTSNLAWDSKSGQVLLTKTVNEYDDFYYTMSFPSYWGYPEMGMSSKNLDLAGKLLKINNTPYFNFTGVNNPNNDISKFLKIGDELVVTQPDFARLWVVGYNNNKTGVKLMRANGVIVNNLTNLPSGFIQIHFNRFRVMRSAFKNFQSQSMASITLMKNPLINVSSNNQITFKENINFSFDSTVNFDPKVVNASAVEYSDIWYSQCENGLPQPQQADVNQFLFNIRGQWRPIKSYAYLTGRNAQQNINTRKVGFYKKFNTFYKYNSNPQHNKWVVDSTNWTFASKVSKYNPHGVEIENRDALKRYSSAQYGYQYKLPTAVASNSRYREMGFDGFEDYPINNTSTPSIHRPHFGFNQALNQNVSISSTKSHSGNHSLKVLPNNSVSLNRKIEGCQPIQDTINTAY